MTQLMLRIVRMLSALSAAHAPSGDARGDEAQPERALIPGPDDVPPGRGHRLGLLRGDALDAPAHENAPGGAAEVVVMVDLEGDVRLLGKGGEDAVIPGAHEHVAVVDPVVHRDDLDPPVVHEPY